jgi:predicted lipoprotein with Yx(FWY)xxD motif
VSITARPVCRRPRITSALAPLVVVPLLAASLLLVVPGTAAMAATGTTVATRATSLGLVVSDAKGRTLYLSTHDATNLSRCSATCAKVWKRLLTSATPRAGRGITQRHLGQTKTHQVTYYGHPLYYYSGDTAAGQTRGQGRSAYGGTWWVLGPGGAAGTGATVTMHTTRLGSVLANTSGRTLYLFQNDTSTTSTCTGACASAWPPLITTGRPHAGSGATSGLVATTRRADGTLQVTYNKHPVYTYGGDSAAGDVNGQGAYAYGNYWYALDSSGNANMTY